MSIFVNFLIENNIKKSNKYQSILLIWGQLNLFTY